MNSVTGQSTIIARGSRMPRFSGYVDCDGRYVAFKVIDEAFSRARGFGLRVLLRLELKESGELQGMLYTASRNPAKARRPDR